VCTQGPTLLAICKISVDQDFSQRGYKVTVKNNSSEKETYYGLMCIDNDDR
jgi:hypothetical protein